MQRFATRFVLYDAGLKYKTSPAPVAAKQIRDKATDSSRLRRMQPHQNSTLTRGVPAKTGIITLQATRSKRKYDATAPIAPNAPPMVAATEPFMLKPCGA
jgi:hypothetical protein